MMHPTSLLCTGMFYVSIFFLLILLLIICGGCPWPIFYILPGNDCFRENKNLTGTARYASMNTHLGIGMYGQWFTSGVFSLIYRPFFESS